MVVKLPQLLFFKQRQFLFKDGLGQARFQWHKRAAVLPAALQAFRGGSSQLAAFSKASAAVSRAKDYPR